MKKSYLKWFFVVGMGIALGACSSDDDTSNPTPEPGTGTQARYVVASAPIG